MRLKLIDRDYQWLIALLVFAIIFLCTLFFGGKGSEVVSYLGFAGTLISITLSLLAITYAFFQGGASITAAERLSQASTNLQMVLDQFASTQSQLAVAVSSFHQIESQMEHVNKTVTNIEGKMEQSLPGQTQLVIDTASGAQVQSAIITSVRTSSHSGVVFLLLGAYQALNPRKGSFADIVQMVNDNDPRFILEVPYGYGFFIGLQTAGAIRFFDYETFGIQISCYDLRLDVIEEELRRRSKDDSIDMNIRSYLLGAHAHVRSMYATSEN